MSKKLHRERAETTKRSLYEEITARIITDLEAGVFPWAQPWSAGPGNAALGLPRNAATGKSYSGINILILWGRLFDKGFTSQSWLTFRQALSLGGTVRKGEHGVSVCYADKFIPKRERSNDAGGGESPNQEQPEGAGEAVPFLRRYIPLSNLKIASVNVRQSRKPPDVSDILPSIRARGVLQPLLVRPNGKSFEVVAGRRRYFAAAKVAEEQGVSADEVLLPCAITAKGDDVGAMEASLIENVARAPMDELEEYEAFAKLLKQGRGVADIATTFGATELYVKQRFALANLHSRIKDAYREGDIEAEDLQCLTSATRRQQKEWIKAFEQEKDDENDDAEPAPRGHHLKQWLFGGEQIATGAALFPIGDYKGEIITDLFGDVTCFADREAFWALQNVAIARLRDQLVANGWKVTVLEKGERFAAWQHVETTKEDGGKAFIEIRDTGEVEVHEGYLGRDERRPRRNGSDPEGEPEEVADRAARGELTKAAENYLALHRHAIVRAELLSQPNVALRLSVAHMIAGSPLWSVKPDPQRADKEEIAGTVRASKAQAAFEAERQAVLQLLDIEAGYLGTVTRGNGDPHWGAAVFARLLALPDEAVLRVLALVMAETLAAGSALVEAAGVVIKPDVTRWWAADDTFLDLVRDRTAINAMLGEVAGKAIADANVSETAKVQRKIVRDCLGRYVRYHIEDLVDYSKANQRRSTSDAD